MLCCEPNVHFAAMLALLLQTIENALGPSLAFAASVAFWTGIAMVVYMGLVPVARVALDIGAASIGLARHWVMQCPTCKRTAVVSGAACEHCGKPLGIPLHVRVRNFFSPEVEPDWWRYLRWFWSGLGVAGFTIATLAVLIQSGAWSPQTNVEKLLVGLALIAWAGLAWLTARVLGLNTGGPISRLRDAVFALAALAVLSTLVTLAVAARPVPETLLARVTVQGQVAQVNGQSIPLVGYLFGFEYLQLDHAVLGYQKVIPLAVVGSSSIALPQSGLTRRISDHFWEHANAYTSRGLSVRKRTEQVLVNETGIYDVVLQGREIRIVRYAVPGDS
jgi:hypothetical protein